jgi:hypothetical protein
MQVLALSLVQWCQQKLCTPLGGVGLDATVARAEGREGEAATNTSEAVTAQREVENTRSSRSKRRVDGKIILSTYFDET